jgi:hypothetical protein
VANTANNKGAVRPRTLMAHLVLAELRQEAQVERLLVDDDTPRQPELDALSSAQSRRAGVLS